MPEIDQKGEVNTVAQDVAVKYARQQKHSNNMLLLACVLYSNILGTCGFNTGIPRRCRKIRMPAEAFKQYACVGMGILQQRLGLAVVLKYARQQKCSNNSLCDRAYFTATSWATCGFKKRGGSRSFQTICLCWRAYFKATSWAAVVLTQGGPRCCSKIRTPS